MGSRLRVERCGSHVVPSSSAASYGRRRNGEIHLRQEEGGSKKRHDGGRKKGGSKKRHVGPRIVAEELRRVAGGSGDFPAIGAR